MLIDSSSSALNTMFTLDISTCCCQLLQHRHRHHVNVCVCWNLLFHKDINVCILQRRFIVNFDTMSTTCPAPVARLSLLPQASTGRRSWVFGSSDWLTLDNEPPTRRIISASTGKWGRLMQESYRTYLPQFLSTTTTSWRISGAYRKSLTRWREMDAWTNCGMINAMKLNGELRISNRLAVTNALAGSRWPPIIMNTRNPASRT